MSIAVTTLMQEVISQSQDNLTKKNVSLFPYLSVSAEGVTDQ